MEQVALGLGGNEGDVKKTLEKAILKIGEQIGEVALKSSWYKTAAWGVENQPDFINMVISILTPKRPQEVLALCLAIEKELGRERKGKEKWHQRVIDIDVLFYGDEVIKTTSLIVPHPFVQDRNFVLFPLAEILPKNIHPYLKKNFLELKEESLDKQGISLLEYKI